MPWRDTYGVTGDRNFAKESVWISVDFSLPKESGWYCILTCHGESEAPFVKNDNGKLVWVVPDASIITHWKNK
jgi:hypothetical protein